MCVGIVAMAGKCILNIFYISKLFHSKTIFLNQQPELFGFWTLSIARYSKN
jgi:hypothetical protein